MYVLCGGVLICCIHYVCFFLVVSLFSFFLPSSSLVWDESNLATNELERIQRGPRMQINEPKTPFRYDEGGSRTPSPRMGGVQGLTESHLETVTNPQSARV